MTVSYTDTLKAVEMTIKVSLYKTIDGNMVGTAITDYGLVEIVSYRTEKHTRLRFVWKGVIFRKLIEKKYTVRYMGKLAKDFAEESIRNYMEV